MTILGNVSLLAGELTINEILLNGFPLLQSWRFFQRFFPSMHLYASKWPLLTPPPQSKSNIQPAADEEENSCLTCWKFWTGKLFHLSFSGAIFRCVVALAPHPPQGSWFCGR
jgi:hypothetical protein